MKDRKPTVFALFFGHQRNPNACDLYRVHMPLHQLHTSHGWNVGSGFFNQMSAKFADNPIANWVGLFKKLDVLIIPRAYSSSDEMTVGFKDLFDTARSFGCKIVYEVDDDLTNVHRTVIDGDILGVASMVDAMSVTGQYLGDMMKDRVSVPYFIAKNRLDPRVWNTAIKEPRNDGKIVIALTGSITHRVDWQVLETVLPDILVKYKNVQLVMAGYQPDYLFNLPNSSFLGSLPYENEYAALIQQSDIVLAPLTLRDKFNLSKSPIKAVEGMGAMRYIDRRKAGAAVIATDHPVYRSAVVPGTGLLVHQTPSAWKEALERLIEDEEFRKAMQYKAYKHAWRNFNLEDTSEWREGFERVISETL